MALSKKRQEDRTRGLPSLEQARFERRRAIVAGKVRFRAMPPQFWLWAGLAIAAILVVYWKFAQGALESQKSAVMAKQRAMAQSLGPKILPFRDKVEAFVQSLAKGSGQEQVATDADYDRLARASAVYLRLRLKNAGSPDEIRRASVRSLRDGFTSCFFLHEKARDPSKGPPCNSPADCESGQLCNEYDVCAPPPEPYNMRLAYRSLRVLSNAWTDELHEATSELAVTAYERDLDRVTREDVPVAAKILARAKYFVGVLDEDPQGGLPTEVGDGGYESEEERAQRVPHYARIGIWEIASGKQLVRLRRRARGRAVPVGDHVVKRTETVHAQQRQVLSCSLALDLKQALEPKQQSEAVGAADGGVEPDAGSDPAAP